MVGFAILKVVLDEVELLSIGVIPELRGNSFGKYFFGQILKICTDLDASVLFLEVHEKNEIPINLYKSFGLEVIGRRKSYYQVEGKAPIDALVLKGRI